ncbi:MAG: hypothetical protein IJM20_01235 [Clostridia bacterium]|nr:hypothetical protein [Clostridia bacterium]
MARQLPGLLFSGTPTPGFVVFRPANSHEFAHPHLVGLHTALQRRSFPLRRRPFSLLFLPFFGIIILGTSPHTGLFQAKPTRKTQSKLPAFQGFVSYTENGRKQQGKFSDNVFMDG